MTRAVVVLRPEPGNAATAARVEAAGWAAIRLPLFALRPRAWVAPDPADFDAIVLTSANAARHAGPELARIADLPALAVGVATADAARDAGLHVRLTGLADAESLLAGARATGVRRALHLAGQDRLASSAPIARAITVYASEPVPVDQASLRTLSGAVALLHSPRAGERLAALVDAAGLKRSDLRLATLSHAVAVAAGDGWAGIAAAARPTDAALLDAARALVG